MRRFSQRWTPHREVKRCEVADAPLPRVRLRTYEVGDVGSHYMTIPDVTDAEELIAYFELGRPLVQHCHQCRRNGGTVDAYMTFTLDAGRFGSCSYAPVIRPS